MTPKWSELKLCQEKMNWDKSRPEQPRAKMGTLTLTGGLQQNCPATQTHKGYLMGREQFERKGRNVFSKQFNNSKVRLYFNIPNVEAHLFQVAPGKQY